MLLQCCMDALVPHYVIAFKQNVEEWSTIIEIKPF
ncbi:hypothetical protein EVA_22621 [gut metagenome]|uniref:Uncharacterized protein n=1 Tax=gut metagenome TaxID=749906 RepID=J9FHZ5_9ZZZZ